MPDVLQVSRIDFGQESLSGLELSLILERIKRLETRETTDIRFVPYAVTDPLWVNDVSNCIVFYGLTQNTTVSNPILKTRPLCFA